MTWTEHPMLPIPSDDEMMVMEPEELIRIHSLREEAIKNSKENKYQYGWIFESWKKIEKSLEELKEVLVSGGNRASKTEVGAYLVVKAAVSNPYSVIFCFCQTSEVSVRQQQASVYDWLPPEFKTRQTSDTTYISYKVKTGFTDGSLILPNGSKIVFLTYSQYAARPTVLEGAETGSWKPTCANIGVWLDEYLGGPEILETMRYRNATRSAKMLITFTPIYGMTDVIRQFVDKASIVETREAELLGGQKIPTVLRSHGRAAAVHYLWTQDNPWSGYVNIKDNLRDKPKTEILIRAYGIASQSSDTKFPLFNKAVNVIKSELIPKENVTRYFILDPAGNKNWFMCWIAVDATDTFYVYREWPDVGVGDWAKQSRGKWVPGHAAKGQGKGIKDYVDLILSEENGEVIHERFIDPRLGASTYQGIEGASSIIEDLEDNNIICIPAPGARINKGIQDLVNKMAWNPEKPMDSINRPHFYVSEDCQNIIQAIAEYTGDDGKDEAWKDPIDVLRYAAIAKIDHVEEHLMRATKQGSGGY